MTESIFWAQVAAVALVLFAGLNIYQLTASYPELEEKALRFAEISSEEGAGSLAWVRFFAYGILPSIFMATLILGGLSLVAIAGSGLKVGLSASLSVWIENRLLAGEGYSPERHRMARLDGIANLLMSIGLIYLLLIHWLQ